MKKILFTFVLLSALTTMKASSDTSFIDSLCFVEIIIEPSANGLQLTALGFDFDDPMPSFSYAWSTGDTSQSIILNGNGTYCVTLTSASTGCIAANCITVDLQDCDVSTWYLPWTNELFAYGAGVPPFTYAWSTGDTTPSITAAIGDTFCVTIIDALGCEADTCGVVQGQIDTFCFADIFVEVDSSGNIVLNALGGDIILPPNGPHFTYLWSTGDTTESIMVTNQGEYCVTVSNGSCAAESCIDLSDLDCNVFIGCDPPGTFTAFAWGVHPFTYEWSTGATDAQIPVSAGETYCVTITDALGCTSDTCMTADTIVFPPDTFCFVLLNIEANPTGIVVQANAFPFWDSTHTYLWNTGETTASIIGIPGENYCVTVTYSSGCVASACTLIEEFDCTDLYVLCDPDGTLGVISAGLPPFTYLWSTGDTTEFILGETDSTYCVTITDAANCVADTCITVMAFPPDTFNLPASIFGAVYDADSSILSDYQGLVYLYQKDAQADYVLVDSTPIQGDLLFNSYVFNDVEDGEYLTKAVAQSLATGEDFIPTYHYSAMEWSDADEIVVNSTNPIGSWVQADIILLSTTSLNGPGSINGIITDINNIVNGNSRSGSGFAGVTIILTDEQNQTLDFAMTYADGKFNFSDLPYGTYHVHADYINLSGPYAIVTIGPGQEHAEISFEVDENDVYLDNNQVDLSSEINIFPNPASDRIFIETSSDILVNSIQVSNMQGKNVMRLTDLPHNEVEINTEEMAYGIHVIQLITNRGILNQKIMIIE